MRRKIASGSGGVTQQQSIVQPATPLELKRDGIVNAYWQQDSVVLVESGGASKKHPARFATYCRLEHATGEVLRNLRNSRAVTAIKREGEWVRIEFRDADFRRTVVEWLETKALVPTFEGDLNPVRRLMVDTEPLIVPPKACFIDIETDSRIPFSKKEEMRILVISMMDAREWRNKRWRFELNEDTDEDEARLLSEFWAQLNGYDQVIGWNLDRFDAPVIVSRTKQRKLMVPWKRWLWLDHLELFRRMNMMAAESGEEKQSMKLDSIAKAVLGHEHGKIAFDASKTWEAWEAGGDERRQLFVYCDHDTELMPMIEEETGYIALLNTLCEVTGAFPDTMGINPQQQVEAFMLRLAKHQGYKPRTPEHRWKKREPNTVQNEFVKEEAFRGAFVLQPKGKGFLRNVHVCDFASLYPSIILSWNMSPETKKPKLPDPNASRPHYLPRVSVTPDQLRPAGCAMAPFTQVCFTQEKVGILPEAITELIRLRKEWNERKAKLPPGTDEWKEADRRSTAYKIAGNSFYGVVGAGTSRFHDREVAESTTQSGVWLLQETIKAVEARGHSVVYGDTDSVFTSKCSRQQFEDFVKWANAELYPGLLKSKGCERNFVKLAYEKEFRWVVFVTAKRYVGIYEHYKGTAATADSKPEVRGLEYKRGDALRLARQLQSDVIDLMVKHEDRDGVDPYVAVVERYKKHVHEDELELRDFLISKSLTKELKEYKVRFKKDGSKANRQPHVEIAAKMKERGEDVGEGTRIEYVCVDGSVSPKKYVAIADYGKPGEDGKPPELVDRYELWESFIYPPTQRLLAAAFPQFNWDQYAKTRPPKVRARVAKRRKQDEVTLDLFAEKKPQT